MPARPIARRNDNQRTNLYRKYGNFVTNPTCQCEGCEIERKRKIDAKWWALGKKVPFVKVVYGAYRGISYAREGDWEEALKSFGHMVGGIVEVAFFYYAGVAMVGGPLGYVICASLPGPVIGGGIETLVSWWFFEPSSEGDKFDWEKQIYENVIKDIAFIGGGYSLASAAVYKFHSGDSKEATDRLISGVTNIAVSSVAVGITAHVHAQSTAANANTAACPNSNTPSQLAPTPVADSSSTQTLASKTLSVAKKASQLMEETPTAVVKTAGASGTAGASSASALGSKVIQEEASALTTAAAKSLEKTAISAGSDVTNIVRSEISAVVSDAAMAAPKNAANAFKNVAKTASPSICRVPSEELAVKPLVTAGVQRVTFTPAPVLREVVAAVLYRNCPFGLMTIGVLEPKFNYITRCILHSLFDAVDPDNHDPLDEADVKQLASKFLEMGNEWVTQALLLWLPFGSSSTAPYLDDDHAENIQNEDQRTLTQYLVKKMHPGTGNVQFPETLNRYKEFKCPRGDIVHQTVSVFNGGPSGLCLDGGGVRGLNTLEILSLIESEIHRIAEGTSLSTAFDYYVGTSVGAIISAAILIGRTVKEIKNLIFKLKNDIFAGSAPHDNEKLEELLNINFGPTLKIRDVGREHNKKLVISVTRADTRPFQLDFYTNSEEDCPIRANEPLVKVLLRATAAPGFFHPPREEAGHPQHIDGGLKANNATTAFLQYLRRRRERPGFVLSVGTGKFTDTTAQPFPKIHRSVVKDGPNARTMIITFANELANSDGEVTENHAEFCKALGSAYFRLTPTLSEDIELNEKDDYKLLRMMYQTKVYAHEHHKKIRQVVQHLVLHRQHQQRRQMAEMADRPSQRNSISDEEEAPAIISGSGIRRRVGTVMC